VGVRSNARLFRFRSAVRVLLLAQRISCLPGMLPGPSVQIPLTLLQSESSQGQFKQLDLSRTWMKS